jgi:hypothetical protein
MKLHAAWQAIRAAYESTAMASEVRASLLQLTQEVGQFVLALFRDEAVGFVDHLSRDLQRQGIDETKAMEHALWLLERCGSDQAVMADHLTRNFDKQSVDQAIFSDDAWLALERALSEHPSLASWAYFALERPLVEVVRLLDHEAKHTGKDSKDLARAIDRLCDDFRKSIAEALRINAEAVFALTKLLADRLAVTDDTDGASSAEDDQEVAFFKQVQHLVAVNESLVRSVGFTRLFQDWATLRVAIKLALDQQRGDGARLDDQRQGRFTKPLLEALQGLEQVTLAFDRRLLEGSLVNDLALKESSKTKQNALQARDRSELSVEKQAADGIALQNRALKSATKGSHDTFGLVDTLIRSIGFIREFYERASIADHIAQSPSKLVADASFASDRVGLESAKKAPEQVTLSEAYRRDLHRQALESVSIANAAARFLERRLTTDGLRASEDLIRWIGSMRGDQLTLSDQLQRALGLALTDQSPVMEQLTKHGNVLRVDGVAWFDRREMASSKRSSDAVVMTDSGFWDQQSYAVDPAFFAADYVGKRQYF